ncbi:hypothetical protein BI375_02595 [Vibrio rotiferianus]|uniref:Lipoprotein n=1 Tax=Vibrio rotiferianus TaxID=190895 RepID=A0ABX3DE78_9VIBR|nr:hypothetical protein [Vibrio rotiferianus]OHY96422.1 hypothetical protein BI375_02595 [Vibrio rotiferianus]
MIRLYAFFFLTIIFSSYTLACDKRWSDFSVKNYVEPITVSFKDIKTDEQVERYYYVFPDGDLIIFESRYCLINNFNFSYQSSDVNNERVVIRMNQLLNQIARMYDLNFESNFVKSWLEGMPRLYTEVSSKTENIDVASDINSDENQLLPFQATLSLSIGGLD